MKKATKCATRKTYVRELLIGAMILMEIIPTSAELRFWLFWTYPTARNRKQSVYNRSSIEFYNCMYVDFMWCVEIAVQLWPYKYIWHIESQYVVVDTACIHFFFGIYKNKEIKCREKHTDNNNNHNNNNSNLVSIE